MPFNVLQYVNDRINEYASGQKTPYQQNLSTPAQTNQNSVPTTRQIYSKIWEIGQTDPESAKKYASDFINVQNDPSSPYFNPYRSVTNKSVSNLSELGIDTSNINDDWFTQTADLENYLHYDGTTNAPTKPGKKASALEKAAYERYQIGKANDLTKQAKTEWAALQEELSYWAKDSGRNYSDDEIIEKIYGRNNEKLAKKYPTLARMENSLQTGKDILELNSAINYSKDNAYTAIWRARNEGGTGDWDIDALLNASGQYNGYVRDPDITARLTENTPTYAPWTVGSTMDEVCVYYGKPNFTTEEIASMRPDGSDKTEGDMWNRLYDADQFTIRAEEQAAKFNERLEKKLEEATDVDDTLQWFEKRLLEDQYSDLKALDDSTKRVNDLKDTTRPINFSRYDVEQRIRQKCEENANKPAPVENVANAVTEPDADSGLTQEQIETSKVEDQNIRDAREALDGQLTDDENAVLQNAGSSMWDFMRDLYTGAMDTLDKSKRMVQTNADDAAKGYVKDILPVVVEVANYNTKSDAYERDSAELAEYQRRFGDLANYYDEIETDKDIDLGNGAHAIMYLDENTGKYVVEGVQTPEATFFAGQKYAEGSEAARLMAEAERAAAREDEHAQEIKYAHARLQYGGKEIQDEIKRYGQLNAQVQNENNYLREHDLQYDEGQKAIERAEKEMAVLGLAGRFLGADTSGMENARAMTDYFSNFAVEPPRPNHDSTYLERITESMEAFGADATPEVISQHIQTKEEDVRANIQLAEEMLAYADEMGIELPDNYRQNMEYYIEDWQKELQGLEYARILTDTDPAEIDKAVEAGRAFEEKNEGNMHYWTNLFNEAGDFYTLKYQDRYTDPDGNTYRDVVSEDDERTYYYLLGKKVLEMGEDLDSALNQIATNPEATREAVREVFSDAKDYQQYMESDVWKNREYNSSVEYGRKLAQETPVIANLMATGATIGESVASFLEILDKAVLGGRFDSQSFAGRLTGAKNAIREETRASLENTFGKDTLAYKIANIGFEIYCNRGDSMMNSMFFGWLTGGLGGIAGELIGSAPMGFTAALSAAAEAVENGASTDQAWLIAGITFLAETGTEAITLSNIKEAFGTTEGLTKESVKGFLKDWLTKDGLEEVFGEVTNNILERTAEKWAANLEDNDYQNAHKQRVDKYLSEGKKPDEAEQLATMDELKDDLHTAVVSYLSAGTGVIVQTGKAALNTTNYYRTATRAAQQAGDSRSMLRHMLDDHKANKAAGNQPTNYQGIKTTTTSTKGNQEVETGLDVGDVDIDFQTQATEEVEPLVRAEQEAEQQAKTERETQYAKDIEVLTSAMKSGATASTTAGVAAMLTMDSSDASADQANAAAVRAGDVFGGGISEIRDIIVGGAEAGTDNTAVKIGIMQAILGGEESESYQMLQSEEFQNATNEQKAEMLAQTGETDSQNPRVQQFVNNRIREMRIAAQTRDALAKGAMKVTMEAQQKAEQAAADAREAQEQLEVRQSETQAADESRAAAANEALQNPTDDNVKQADQANQKFMAAVSVEQEYEQSVRKAEEKRAEAEQAAKQKYEEDMAAIRGQSEATVNQQNQQREEIAAQREEQRMIREQEQAEEDQRSGKADEDKTRAMAENWAKTLNLTGEAVNGFVQRVMDRQAQKTLGKIDLTGKLTNSEGYLAIMSLARKTGLMFKMTDTLPDTVRGAYENGVVFLNENLVKSGNMTVGQALVEASLHEMTHAMEQAKSYIKYKNTILDFLFGAGKDRNTESYNNAVAERQAAYRKVGQNLTETEAVQEIVADFARTHLADKDVVQRFMDAGMGGKVRNALHSINQALKNFFGNLKGEERTTAEYLRKAERLYQRALNQVAKGVAKVGDTQLSVNQLEQANQDYMQAVENGDMETAQEAVDFVAEQNGYTDKVYHGTNSFGFTKFNMGKGKGLIFTSYSKDLAGTYSTNEQSGIYNLYAKPGNQLIVDAEYRDWDDVPIRELAKDAESKGIEDVPEWWYENPIGSMSTREIAEYAKKHGYDSVRINNVVDNGSEGNVSGLSDVGIFFNQSDVKSADPITYDDNGNVIPPSERFNRQNPDIRYSTEGDITDADIDQMLEQAFEDQDNAISRGDTETAQETSEFIGDITGVTDPAAMETIREEAEKSMQSDFANSYDAWDKTSGGVIFNVGRPSAPLLSIGVPDNEIRLTSDEVLHIKKKHPGMSDDVIKQIPSIVDNPILVMESFTVPGRITMFGELMDDNGAPVLAILTTSPEKDVNANVDFLKMNSAYGKDTYLQEFIDKCKILYRNENRAASWAASLRLNLPSASAQNGSSDVNISQAEGNVNGRYSSGGEITDADIDNMLARNGLIRDPNGQMTFLNTVPEEETFRPREAENPGAVSAGNGPQRQFGSENGMLSESDEIDQIAKNYVMSQDSYVVDSNPEQIDRAINWIRHNKSVPGSDGFYESMQKITSNGFDYSSADGQARMVAMMGMAVAKNDLMSQITLADAFNRQGTDLGRALQARKLFRMMTPQGRIGTLQKLLQNTAEETNTPNLKFSDWIYQAAAVATEETDFAKVYAAAANELAEQIPANWKDKLRGFRMLSMLGNPRTHIRNIIGNAMFIPMVTMKNKIAAMGEIVARVKQGERTKTLGLANKEAREFASTYVDAVEADLRGDAKYDDRNAVKHLQKTWGTGKGIMSRTLGKMLQGLSDVNSNFLEAEDWVFLKYHFKRALGGYMTANHLTSKEMVGKTLEKATQYAILEAHKATYRDANSVASALSNFSKRAKGTRIEKGAEAVQFVVDAVVPFKKTPANILRRGIEYSPMEAISIGMDIKPLIQTIRYMNDKKNNPEPKRMVTPAQFIDKCASMLTGSGILALGAAFAALGAANAGLDDDDPEDRLKLLEGEQKYGVNFGKALNAVTDSLFNIKLFGEDATYTMDWAAPFSMPFFVGVSLYKELYKERGEDSDAVGEILNSILGITEPVFNLSMLDGVNSLFNVSQNDPMNPALQVAMKVLLNYGSSYVPTLLGQVARTADRTRRANFVQTGSKPYQLYSTIEQVQNKIPGLANLNIPYRNAYGEAEQNGTLLENFFAPWYKKKIKADEITKEIRDVFDTMVGEHKNLIPTVPDKSFRFGEETIRFTDKEYEQYQTTIGETAVDILNDLIQTDEYKMSSPDTKATMMEYAWAYAEKKGKREFRDVKLDTWMTAGERNGDMVGAIINKVVDDNQETYVGQKGEDLLKCFDNGDMDTAKAIILDLKQNAKIPDDKIREQVSNYFRPLYYEAWGRQDDDAMDDIKDVLNDFGIGYGNKTYSSWNTNAKKYYETGEDIADAEAEDEEPIDINRWLNFTLEQ